MHYHEKVTRVNAEILLPYVSTLQGDLMTCKLPSAPFGAAFGGVSASESLIRSSAQFAVSLNAQQYVPIPQDRKAPGTAPDFDVHAGFGLYKLIQAGTSW